MLLEKVGLGRPFKNEDDMNRNRRQKFTEAGISTILGKRHSDAEQKER